MSKKDMSPEGVEQRREILLWRLARKSLLAEGLSVTDENIAKRKAELRATVKKRENWKGNRWVEAPPESRKIIDDEIMRRVEKIEKGNHWVRTTPAEIADYLQKQGHTIDNAWVSRRIMAFKRKGIKIPRINQRDIIFRMTAELAKPGRFPQDAEVVQALKKKGVEINEKIISDYRHKIRQAQNDIGGAPEFPGIKHGGSQMIRRWRK